LPKAPDTGHWTPQRRSALVLRIIRGETSVAEAARAHGLTPSEIDDWQRRFVRGATDALCDDRPAAAGPSVRANWRFGVVFLAILAIWLGFRVAYWNGYYVEDAPGYVTDAIYLALGNYHARDYITGLNVGTYVPVALPLKLLGKSEVALGVWPLFCSLVGVLSLAGAAGMLFGRRFGLLAALLYATYPGDVFFSTVVMPDAIQAGWLALSVFLVVFGYAGAPRWTSWSVAGGGIAMGVCNLIRGNGPILLPVGLCAVVVFAWLRRCERVRAIINGTVVYLTAWVIVQIGEGVAYLWADGDVLHRFHVVNRHYGTVQSIPSGG